MDADRRSESLRDTIGIEVERALAIDVAPGLHSHIRARIARERASAAWWKRRFAPIGAALLAAAALLIAIRAQPDPERAPAPRAPHEMAASPVPPVAAIDAGQPIPESTVVEPPTRAVAARTERVPRVLGRLPSEPDVPLPDERTALGLLLANIRQGRIDPIEPAARPLDAPLEPPDEITIEPIVIKPLARLESVEGERQ